MLVATACVVGTWLVNVVAVAPLQCYTLTCVAQWGDSFGAINSLFAGLAFAGLLVNLRLQQVEIEWQRRQFVLVRISEQEQQLRRTSLDLYGEWTSQVMLESRSVLRKAVRDLKGAKRSISWRVLAAEDPLVTEQELKDVVRVIAFFERWAILRQHRCLDHALLARLMREPYEEFRRDVLEPLSQAPAPNGQATPDIRLIAGQLSVEDTDESQA